MSTPIGRTGAVAPAVVSSCISEGRKKKRGSRECDQQGCQSPAQKHSFSPCAVRTISVWCPRLNCATSRMGLLSHNSLLLRCLNLLSLVKFHGVPESQNSLCRSLQCYGVWLIANSRLVRGAK